MYPQPGNIYVHPQIDDTDRGILDFPAFLHLIQQKLSEVRMVTSNFFFEFLHCIKIWIYTVPPLLHSSGQLWYFFSGGSPHLTFYRQNITIPRWTTRRSTKMPSEFSAKTMKVFSQVGFSWSGLQVSIQQRQGRYFEKSISPSRALGWNRELTVGQMWQGLRICWIISVTS